MTEETGNYGAGVRGVRADQFLYFIQHGRGGAFHREVSDLITKAVLHARQHGVVTKVKIELAITATDVEVQIKDGLSFTLPLPKRLGTILYADDVGSLSRMHPDQARLELRSADGAPINPDTLRQV